MHSSIPCFFPENTMFLILDQWKYSSLSFLLYSIAFYENHYLSIFQFVVQIVFHYYSQCGHGYSCMCLLKYIYKRFFKEVGHYLFNTQPPQTVFAWHTGIVGCAFLRDCLSSLKTECQELGLGKQVCILLQGLLSGICPSSI